MITYADSNLSRHSYGPARNGCDLGIGEDFESVRKAIRRYC